MAGKRCRALTVDEFNQVRQSFGGTFGKRDESLFVLGCKTGFRISELLSLKVKDVWNGESVRDYVTVNRSQMKGKSKNRSIKINGDVKPVVSEWLQKLLTYKGTNADTYLFKSRKGNKAITIQQVNRILDEAYQSCGLDGELASHSMRKTFAERVRKATGGDIYAIKEMLGHANIQSTVKYLGIDQDKMDSIIDQI
jgi:site-specific recombinase XerD